MRVLISCPYLAERIDKYAHFFRERKIEMLVNTSGKPFLRADHLLKWLPACHGIIAGDDKLTRSVLEQCPNLRAIAKWGIGTDSIDKDYAKKRNIIVTNTPAMFGDEVADVAIGYIIMLARNLHIIHQKAREGKWHKPHGVSLRNKLLGIVGMGSIGQALAPRAEACGMHVHFYDPYFTENQGESHLNSLSALLQKCDFLSLNCPLTPENKHMINEAALKMMNPTAFIVNTARGGLIEEQSLVQALSAGTIAGAALDVLEQEPIASDNPLIGFPNVILGSHNASNTFEAIHRTNLEAIDNLIANLQPGNQQGQI